MNKYDEAIEFGCAEVGCAYIEEYKPRLDFYKLAIEALQQAKERENPQPLTLEQLKERVGKPVWIEELKIWGILIKDLHPDDRCGEYFIASACDIGHTMFYSIKLHTFDLYDHEPKGE